MQVDRIDRALQSLIPCYRDAFATAGGRRAADGRVYPVGERWEWRRIELRREAIAVILDVDPTASIRVVRDVLARFGHRVSHEQVRTDMAHLAPGLPARVESMRWLSLEEWRDETARLRSKRARPRTGPGSSVATRQRRTNGMRTDRKPVATTASEIPTAQVAVPASVRRDDWAVWDDAAHRTGAT
jgi:hypothetical protein